MKNSERNRRNELLHQDKLARGKPAISKFERKRLTPEEIHARQLDIVEQQRGIVAK